MNRIKVMISLIEGEYSREERNTPSKMRRLIKKEFDFNISEQDILNICGLTEDYEKLSNKIEYGQYY